MSDGTFNIAKGKVAYYAMLGETSDALIAVLLKSGSGVSDADLIAFDDLETLLAGGYDECDFTNYARKTLASVTVTPDDTNDRIDVDAADLVYTDAGGASNNTTAKLLICYDADTGTGDDGDIIPLSHHDLTINTDGSTVTVQFPTGGFWRAQEAA